MGLFASSRPEDGGCQGCQGDIHFWHDWHVRPADVVIEPDVTGLELTDFVRAREAAAIGEAAAREQIPKIQRLLTRLDPQLFRFES